MSSVEPKVIFALDFGTDGFQTAFAPVGNVSIAQLVQEWPAHQGLDKKPKSAILLNNDPEQSVVAFGWEARERYLESKDGEEKRDELTFGYFDNFKLKLLQDGAVDFDSEMHIQAADNRYHCKLSDLVTKCLREIKTHSLDYYRRRVTPIEDNECFWILTVPVAWTEQSREVMKVCCEKAGILRENLLIVTEPEAAGNYFLWATDQGLDKREGFKFVVLDCGSGTFDVVVQEIVEVDGNRQLRDIHHADGGLFGALNVDQAFFDIVLTHIFTEAVVQQFKADQPKEYVEQMKTFQQVRERVKISDAQKPVLIEPALFDIAEEHEVDYEENVKSYTIHGMPDMLKLKKRGFRYSLIMKHRVWKQLHDPVVDQIAGKMKEIIEECEDASLLYLVGGFSQSDFVRNEIERLIEDDDDFEECELIKCDKAQVAVTLGALWAVDRKVISRKCKVSYGVEIDREYHRPFRQDEERKVPDAHSSSGYKVPGIFDCLWAKNEDFAPGNWKKREFPLHPGQKDVEIALYESQEEVTHYIDEEGCVRGAKWVYELEPGVVSAQEQKLCIRFEFGEDNLKCGLHVKNDHGGASRVRYFMMKLNPDAREESDAEA